MTAYDRTALLHLARAWAIDSSDETWVYMPAAIARAMDDEPTGAKIIRTWANCGNLQASILSSGLKRRAGYTHLQQLTACIISEFTLLRLCPSFFTDEPPV